MKIKKHKVPRRLHKLAKALSAYTGFHVWFRSVSKDLVHLEVTPKGPGFGYYFNYAADGVTQAIQTFLQDAPHIKKFARALDELRSNPIAKKYRHSNKLLVREPSSKEPLQMRTANTPAKTNFDAIRELSIDQLADILLVANGTSCPPGSVCYDFPTCRDCVLHWLRSPVDLYKYVNKQHSN